ncbi:MAG: terminase, partial [Ruminococcus sp.]|nr:terminase [Ruminococcus sp.]
YKETWLWLKNRGCERLVNKRLLESYSMAFARFIQCEDALSKYGLLGKHPTTGGVVASPFASLSQSYQKQANLLWYEIFDIVKQNCTTKFDGSPQDDLMEQLLRTRNK